MESYGDYCPLSRASEIFATRWTPLILRNLFLGCRTFSEIREGAPGISRTLLTQRLRMLEHHGVVDHVDGEYRLTEAGFGLAPVCMALGVWGEQWLELAPEHFDAAKVLWTLSRHITTEELPDKRTVIRFDVTAPQRESYWLLLDAPGAEVCRRPPGDQDDLVVRATAEGLVRWHVGELTLGDAMHAGKITVEGPRWIEQMLASWCGQGSYAQMAEVAQ
ncbi:MAG: transcriptional regulator [Solirubrobacteraceae bacterium]|nr:transcriptional regulator [Solirubrobacteraceae bacterium]